MKVRNVLPRDAIPRIDTPEFTQEYFGDADDEVIVVEGAPPRAYPLRILSYHEIVNDLVGERPIAVTWCPICWSAAVYDRMVDGRTLTFVVSGKLGDDALVMYDRETGTEWQQPTGVAIEGPLAGRRLDALPAPIMTWARFRDEHPDGDVLKPVRGTDAGTIRSPADVYDLRPYERYVAGAEFGLFGMRGQGERRSWSRNDLSAKTVVLGIEHGGEAMAYPIPWVEEAGGVLTDTVGGRDIVVVTVDGGIHAFEHPGIVFENLDGRLYADGTRWDGVTGRSADGRQLQRVASRRLFAFAWQDAHGGDAFYR